MPGIEVHRRMYHVLDAVQKHRPVLPDVEQALDPVDLRAARLQEHRQPDPEGGPVEGVVEDDGDCPHVSVPVSRRVARSGLARVRRGREHVVGRDRAEARLDDARRRVQNREARCKT